MNSQILKMQTLSFLLFLLVSVSASTETHQPVVSSPLIDNVYCPDQTECSEETTCCPLDGGSYGCCPFPNAVCCVDHLHCCPSDTVCDITHGLCKRRDGITIEWTSNVKNHSNPFKLLPSNLAENNEIPDVSINTSPTTLNATFECPGGVQTCADGYTCCMSPGGDYGCCPLRDAVCCSDHIHCCPKGSFCDSKAGRCSRSSNQVTSQVDEPTENVICPGGEFQCPGQSTCCTMTSGQFGCCPLENASCCPDKIHCCPHGYKCGVDGICTGSKLPFFLPAFSLN